MSKGPAANTLIVAAVIVTVAGVAWYKSAQRRSANARAPAGVPADQRSGATVTDAHSADPAPAARPGELCPETLPTDRSGEAPASAEGGLAETSQPAAGRLPRVVDLGADKCKACKDLAPILEELKKEYAGRVVVEFIDVWKNPQAGEPYKIRVIPTQIFFDRDGREVWRHEGFLPKAEFVAKFAELGVR